MSASKIRVLPENLVNKIAAGEVIERPASVVKELIENSIDAKANKIEIFIENSGKSKIEVRDNGEGMIEDDVLLAFERHATSKISNESDLFNIRTMGFRGEALPSIASISKLTISSKHKSEDVGTQVFFNGGKLIDIQKIARNTGTTITVNNLFFNVPARKKFLKSDSTELKHIFDLVTYLAISHPEIHFYLEHNGREQLNCPITDSLKNRLAMIYDRRIINNLLYLEKKETFMTIKGFIGSPDLSKVSKKEEIFFVNNRYVKNLILTYAVREGYGNLLPSDKFPFVILFIDINPDLVDINVHPAKREIRFSKKNEISNIIKTTISERLRSNDVIPKINLNNESYIFPYPQVPKKNIGFRQNTLPIELKRTEEKNENNYQFNNYENNSQIDNNKILNDNDLQYNSEENLLNKNSQSNNIYENKINTTLNYNLQFYWQLHNTYIFVQIKSGLVIIDQHAAHERILYEKILKGLKEKQNKTQNLLFPTSIELTPSEMNFFTENMQNIIDLGFKVKLFSGRTIVIEGIPADIKNWGDGKVFIEILDELMNLKNVTQDNLAKSFACKAAIKAGQTLNNYEMKQLLDLLFQADNPYSCPHGRPTLIQLSLSELEKKFGRT